MINKGSTEGEFRSSRQGPSPQESRWIVSPLFDLAFFANLWWLLLWLPPFVTSEGGSHVEFWQVYFLTTPHRWMTLVLVATDPDRRAGRSAVFLLLALLSMLFVTGTWWTTGTFTCLALVDYVWNAWHFASQHGGILRIYSRKAGGGRPRLETTCMRVFVTYTALRLAGWTTGWTEAVPLGRTALGAADWIVLVFPAWLIALELLAGPRQRAGKLIYLLSVTAIYAALLFSVRYGYQRLVLPLTVASAAFHAVEYLAIVTFYAWRCRDHGSAAAFQAMARHWMTVLAVYVVCLGLISPLARWNFSQLYIGLNLWAAYLHYAYDGMIWKLRQPETAKVLAVEVPGGG